MVVVFKQIRPSKIKVDAYRLNFLNAMHKVERGIKKDYKACVEGWEHEVKFESIISTKGGRLEVFVGTNDAVFGYVDLGTQPHMIFPKKDGGVLVFPWDGPGSHAPKTVPNWIGTFEEQVPDTIVYKLGVMHPGNEARNFTKMIEQEWQQTFKNLMEEALRDANRQSGHSRSK